jgi:hypothetical protein
MQLDLATVVPLVVSVLGALGIASIVSQWFSSGKDRRAARAAVLSHLGAVEAGRWANLDDDLGEQYVRLRAAIRELETAALIARVPRRPVVLYAQLALAAFWHTRGELEKYEEPEASSLPTEYSNIVHSAAELVSRAAWSSPATRWVWLRWRQRRVARRLRGMHYDDELVPRIIEAQRFIR